MHTPTSTTWLWSKPLHAEIVQFHLTFGFWKSSQFYFTKIREELEKKVLHTIANHKWQALPSSSKNSRMTTISHYLVNLGAPFVAYRAQRKFAQQQHTYIPRAHFPAKLHFAGRKPHKNRNFDQILNFWGLLYPPPRRSRPSWHADALMMILPWAMLIPLQIPMSSVTRGHPSYAAACANKPNVMQHRSPGVA